MRRPVVASPRARGSFLLSEGADLTAVLSPRRLLRWVYAGRLALVSGILLGALVVWGEAEPQRTFLATVAFAVAILVTAASAWHTHLRGAEPGYAFRYGQVIVDALLVTLVVDITGGGASPFAWLYIPVISVGALLLPLPGGILVGVLVAVLFLLTLVWRHEATLTGAVALQMGLFTLVALATGLLGDRMRRAGMALGEIESELRQLRLDTGDILDSIDTGIITIDAEGRLVYVNPAGEELLGIEREVWAGAPIVEAVGNVAPELAEVLRESLESRQALSRRTVPVQRSGGPATIGLSTTVREGEEGPAVTAIFQDITLAERLAEVRRRADRLQAVAEMSASMAHEIKNPLASIRSAVEQFARQELDPEDRQRLTDMVVKESERLSRLLSDFIDFSRMRKDEEEVVDLSSLVEDAVAMVRQNPDLPEELTLRAESVEGPVSLPGDQEILYRAVSNLVLNAAQFSGEGGEVVVSVRDHRRDGEAPAVGVEEPVGVAVRDSGPGVPDEALSRIFDPFYTTREGGSGLGLAVVHRAVEVHDGAIFVENADGGGAVFTLYLPGRAVKEAAGAVAADEREAGGSPETSAAP